MKRYIEQAADYEGKPVAMADHYDQYDEHHVIVKMKDGKMTYFLDWIGAEYAEQPDEFMEQPFENLQWTTVDTLLPLC